MRYLLFSVISLLPSMLTAAQSRTTNDIYKKVIAHYKKSLNDIEVIINTHKNALKYDTIKSTFYYAPITDDKYYVFWKDSSKGIKNGLLFSDDYYILNSTSPEKIRVKKRELKGTIYSKINYVSAWNCKSLIKMISRFGMIETLTKKYNFYLIKTPKATLEVDTFNYRIISLTETFRYKDKIQYDKYEYLRLSDSVASEIRQEILTLAEASKGFPVTTFSEIRKKKSLKKNLKALLFFSRTFLP